MPPDTTANSVRSTRDGPFAWVSKAAMRRIQDRFAESDKVPVASSIYLALCLVASDLQSEKFTVKIALIASRAGVSYKTALGYLRELESAEVIEIRRSKVEGTKLDAPSMYILLPVCSSVTHVCSGGVNASISEKVVKSEKKDQKKTRRQPAARFLDGESKAFPQEVIQSIYEAYPREKRLADTPTSSEERAIKKALAVLSSKEEPDSAAALLASIKGYAIHAKRQPPYFRQSFQNFMRYERYFEFLPTKP